MKLFLSLIKNDSTLCGIKVTASLRRLLNDSGSRKVKDGLDRSVNKHSTTAIDATRYIGFILANIFC